jgi:hypothetical protein
MATFELLFSMIVNLDCKSLSRKKELLTMSKDWPRNLTANAVAMVSKSSYKDSIFLLMKITSGKIIVSFTHF